ncbi:UDP-N-acetylmuramate dehydrogenase [Melioribacter sp. OK-6-Me]|uniref:UDP-N-acetylmuramate dehydrogenase n=1 Tax=unclassified Melioribacter TaxID=2627329 RepID=UPI003ED85E8C
MKRHFNFSLKNYNTFGVESAARELIEFDEEEELLNFFRNNIPENKLILGGGSNILFTKDFEGTIIHYNRKGIEVLSEDNHEIILRAHAGEDWDALVEFTVQNNWYGIENLSLIPGTVGAAPVQNIGAYGVEIKDCLIEVEGVSLLDLKKEILPAVKCKFGYRTSIFKEKLKNQFLITAIVIKLSKAKKLNLDYRALREYFQSRNIEEVDINDVRKGIIEIRQSKLPNPSELGNAGSFFKNPVIDEDALFSFQSLYRDIPYHKIGEAIYKVPAAWLIEKAGLKGKRIGKVGVHKNQALVIVNYGGATGKEIIDFAEMVRNRVNEKFGIQLEYEVNII